ncbi:MAG: TRAP transporter small permease [Rubrivivax sp.]|nr:TRAP transporter small permease [Rubrivivax sp.]
MGEPSAPPSVPVHAATPSSANQIDSIDPATELARTPLGRAELALVAANRVVLVALMAAMAVLVFANVVARYVFNHSFIWAEELSRYMMVWVGFLGAGLVLRVGAHIAVEVFQDWLPRRAAQAMRAAVVVVLAVALLAMLWLGILYVQFAWGQETPVLNWNFGLVYVAMPIGALLMLVYLALIAAPYVRDRAFRQDSALSAEEAVL